DVRRAHRVRGVGMTRMRRGAIGVVLVMGLLASVVTLAVGAKLAGEKVRLGVIMPQAGIFVDWGQHGIIGAEIARDEINSAGGIGGLPLELVMVDDRGDPKESVTLTRRLAQTDRVLMIHGSISSSSAGVMYPLSASLKVPIVSPTAAAPGLTDKFRPWAYTMNPGTARALGTGLVALGGDAVEGWYTTTYAWNERPIPRMQTFVKKFLERSGGKRPNSSGPAMYDQLFIAKTCIETSGVTNKPDDLESDRDKLAKCWAGLKGYDGASGAITMNEGGVSV